MSDRSKDLLQEQDVLSPAEATLRILGVPNIDCLLPAYMAREAARYPASNWWKLGNMIGFDLLEDGLVTLFLAAILLGSALLSAAFISWLTACGLPFISFGYLLQELSGWLPSPKHLAEVGAFCFVGGIGLAVLSETIGFREAARWHHRTLSRFEEPGLPPFVRSLIRSARELDPNAVFIIAELKQGRTKLDPVLYKKEVGRLIGLCVWDEHGEQVHLS